MTADRPAVAFIIVFTHNHVQVCARSSALALLLLDSLWLSTVVRNALIMWILNGACCWYPRIGGDY